MKYRFPSALALLSSSGGERHFKPGEVRKAREGKEGDNTLEVVTLVSRVRHLSRLARYTTFQMLLMPAQGSGTCTPNSGGVGRKSCRWRQVEVKDTEEARALDSVWR